MSLVGKIQSLFLDREKTQPIFPITKVKAVSDDNGKGLNVLLDDKASKDFVTAKIAEAQLGSSGGEIDLSGFATKDDLNAVNDKIPTTPEQIGAHPNTWIPTVSDVGAAPAGYGLGSEDSKQLTTTDDLNNCGANGFYSWALPPINAPFTNGIMIVATYDWARKVQIVWSAEDARAGKQRVQYGGSWSEWIDIGASAFAPVGHVTDKNNPHGVTIAQIGAAPAGYGLGGKAPITEATKLSDIKETGWYGYEWSIGENPVNGYAGILRVEAIGIMTVQTLYVFSYHNAVLTRQTKTDGTFYDWEWVNPPMIPGVEYRTTERYDGKVVYKKLVTAQLASNTIIYVHLTDANGSLVSPSKVVDVNIRLTHDNPSDAAFYGDGFKDLKNAYMYVTSLELHTTEGYEKQTAYVTFKYVKD